MKLSRRNLLVLVAALVLVGGNVAAWLGVNALTERRLRDHEATVRQELDRLAAEQQRLEGQREVDQHLAGLRHPSDQRRDATAKQLVETVKKEGPTSRSGRLALMALVALLSDTTVELRRTAAYHLKQCGAEALEVALPDLIRALSDSDVQVRHTVAESLGFGPGAAPAVPKLISALYDTNNGVRRAAVVSLLYLGPSATSAAPALVEMLGDEDSFIVGTVEQSLHKLGHSAVPALASALTHHKVQTRRLAVRTLQKIGPDAKETIPALAKVLADDAPLRGEAAAALRAMGPDGFTTLTAALKHLDPAVRKAAVVALVDRRQFAESVPLLSIALADTDMEVRRAAAFANNIQGGTDYFGFTQLSPDHEKVFLESAIPALIKSLSDSDAEVRANAAKAVRVVQSKGEPAIPELSKLLSDPDAQAVEAAAETLGWIGPAAAPALIQGLANVKSSVTPKVAIAVIESLHRIGPEVKEIQPALVKALFTTHGEAQLKVVAALRNFKPSDDAALGLARLLGWHTFAIRLEALSTLAKYGPGARAAVPALTKALANPKEGIFDTASEVTEGGEKIDQYDRLRWRLTSVLGEIGPAAKEAVPVLTKSLSDPNHFVRRNAMSSLGAIGPDADAAVPELIKALADSESDIRKVSATALGQIGPKAKDALPALDAASKGDKDYYVRNAAAEALEKIREAK